MKPFSYLLRKVMDRHMAEYQMELLAKHTEEVENIYKTMRGWRHDYHNHIQTLLALSGNEVKTREYLLELNDDLVAVDTIIKTGNISIDAILNSKLSLIQTKNIKIKAKASVPLELSISDIDLCIIIGNLLDNAMESCLTIPEEEKRYVRMYMGILKEHLYISVTNATKDIEKKHKKVYQTTKDGNLHGFGLRRIDAIVSKYSGYVNRQNEAGVFATEVMLPLGNHSC